MSRYDKYDPVAGGFRAAIAADKAANSSGNPEAVGLDTNGRVVVGAGNTGVVGVLVLTKAVKAGDIVDVMTHGEIVEITTLTAGSLVSALDSSGALAVTALGAGRTWIGHTVEATRLVVRVGARWVS